jgi:hypothetical protein
MSEYVKVIKPGTTKNQIVEAGQVDFYRQYGWEPETAVKVPKQKKTVQPEPAVEEEVGSDIKGE